MVRLIKFIIVGLGIFLFSCSGNKLNDGRFGLPDFNKAMNYFNKEKYMRAKEEFKYIILEDPLSQHANDAQFYMGECSFYQENYNEAIIEYEKYLRMAYQRYSLSQKTQINLCRAYFNQSLHFKKDQSGTNLALTKLQYFIEKESMKEFKPEIELMINELREKIAKKEFETAKFYIRIKEYESSKMYFNNVLNEFYDTKFIESSILNLALLECVLSKENALEIVNLNKASFSSEQDYLDSIKLIEGLNSNEKIGYYLKFIR